MFVRVITARTSDREGLRHQGDRWINDVRPGAEGLLGATSGVTDDGTTIALIRFEDEAAARANSDRPEQRAWWEQTAKYFDVEPMFRESSDVETVFDGGSDAAGFVQIIEGKVKDRARMAELTTPAMMEQLRVAGPDIVGGIRVWLADGAFVEAAYFTGESDARDGESSSEFADADDEIASPYDVTTFVDLHEPTFIAP